MRHPNVEIGNLDLSGATTQKIRLWVFEVEEFQLQHVATSSRQTEEALFDENTDNREKEPIINQTITILSRQKCGPFSHLGSVVKEKQLEIKQDTLRQ